MTQYQPEGWCIGSETHSSLSVNLAKCKYWQLFSLDQISYIIISTQYVCINFPLVNLELYFVCVYITFMTYHTPSCHTMWVYTQFKAKKAKKNESGQTRSALHMHAFNSGNSLPSSEASPELLDSTLSHPCHTNIHHKPCLPCSALGATRVRLHFVLGQSGCLSYGFWKEAEKHNHDTHEVLLVHRCCSSVSWPSLKLFVVPLADAHPGSRKSKRANEWPCLKVFVNF